MSVTSLSKECIVLTTVSKTEESSIFLVERTTINEDDSGGKIYHAGGYNSGIIINKGPFNGVLEESPPRLSIDFAVFLVNVATSEHTKENRQLRFWFSPETPSSDEARVAQDYFKDLVRPSDFPRDYSGFLMRTVKLLHASYTSIQKIVIVLKQMEKTDAPPTRPLSLDDKIELTVEKVLEMIESAYPTPISIMEMATQTQHKPEEVLIFLEDLQEKGVIKAMDNHAYTRVVQNDTEVQVVKQMPCVVKSKQPSIAIITAQYCEKLAVDAVIENKETYYRYTTVGESNVYTLGTIGSHRVVATKLPTVGRTREAMIAAGNTTTRLLGTFQKVEYVFLVGVGGGVPHYTDYNKHVRLGDVVVSAPAHQHKSLYFYCENAKRVSGDEFEFETKFWGPPSLELQEIAQHICAQPNGLGPWLQHFSAALEQMSDDEKHDYTRPDADTDKLYMAIGEKDMIEVGHPAVPEGTQDTRKDGVPVVHLGPLGAGRLVAREDSARQAFASTFGILAYDSEVDAVVESIYGNRKDNYVIIRGIADYKDGTRKKEWQPYASLVAASFAKAIICGMDPPKDD